MFAKPTEIEVGALPRVVVIRVSTGPLHSWENAVN